MWIEDLHDASWEKALLLLDFQISTMLSSLLIRPSSESTAIWRRVRIRRDGGGGLENKKERCEETKKEEEKDGDGLWM